MGTLVATCGMVVQHLILLFYPDHTYEVVYGQPPPTLIPYKALSSSLEVVDRSLQHREATVRILKEHLHNAQHKMKVQVDKKRSEREFEVGELVFVKLRPYKHTSLKSHNIHKLTPRSLGL
ncbi:UNVERIFIED_CONTAM: hypothetical protein Sradi_2043100 [Sesamum radiatum]|uniref:Uncharacterized protein n=1 Tax=Sesamum radiatum TaxID=300843 RepID=A0AAW2TGH3_SESRA